MKKRAILLVSVLLLLVFISPALADHEEPAEVYKSATEYDYPPFSVTTSGEADGFSVDLLKAVAQEVGIIVTFKIDQWSVIKEELRQGELDILPLVGYSHERDEYYDFSVPYIVMYGNIFVRRGNESIQSEADLKDKQIIVMEGDNAHEYALSMNFTQHLILTKSYEEAFRKLSSGEGDAVLAQSLVGEKIINDLGLKNVKAVTQLANDGVSRIKTRLSGFEQKFCFAVKEGDKELLAKLNEGLAIVSENGTYNELYEKWFPFLLEGKYSAEQVMLYTSVIVIPLIIITLIGSLFYVRNDIKKKKLALEKANSDYLALEVHFRDQQKLEAIGTLAGGIAHEINNPINGIMNYSQIIADSVSDGDPLKEYANEIIHETNRVSTIVKNLLHFSRQEKQSYSKAKVEDIIDQTLSLIRTVIRHDQIDLIVEIEPDLPEIKCRSQQIQQVIMNLLTNGRDALNEKYPGYDEDKKLILHCSLINKNDRRWIRITVEDHGSGIPEKVRSKIYDPFFTTKSRDAGTGLGLSISYGIIKEHHGELSFETQEGQYTKFIVDLPVDNGWHLE